MHCLLYLGGLIHPFCTIGFVRRTFLPSTRVHLGAAVTVGPYDIFTLFFIPDTLVYVLLAS